jgi:hypothetical protein
MNSSMQKMESILGDLETFLVLFSNAFPAELVRNFLRTLTGCRTCEICFLQSQPFMNPYQLDTEAPASAQGCQILLDIIYQNRGKYTKSPLHYHMAIKCTKLSWYIPNGHRIYQPFAFQGPPKFSQIGIFGMKIYHLATLPQPLEETFEAFSC